MEKLDSVLAKIRPEEDWDRGATIIRYFTQMFKDPTFLSEILCWDINGNFPPM
jgi:hypothetical protein